MTILSQHKDITSVHELKIIKPAQAMLWATASIVHKFDLR